MSSKSEASKISVDCNSDKVEHAPGENAPIPDGSNHEDLSKPKEKLKRKKKQKKSSSKDKKKLKLSEHEAVKPESLNFTSVDEKQRVLVKTPTKRGNGPAMNNLFDFETIMRSKLAAMNAAASWKDVNIRSSPLDCTTQAKNTFNSSSNSANGLALASAPNSGNIGYRNSRAHSGFLNYKDIDDDWSELELEALLSFVKKYGLGNWNVKFEDPDLQIIRNKTARELAEKWEMVASKMLPYLPNSFMRPVTADRSTLDASHGNGFHSTVKLPTVQFPSAKFPIHRPSPRLGIPPFQIHEGNQALNWGRIKPSSNGSFGPYFQGSSTGAFHSLAGARPRELNPNFNTMNAQLLAQNFRPTSVQTPQIPPSSLSETTVSSPANVGTEARPQLLFGGQIPLPNNLRLNENAGHHDADNRK
ncbi:uncharacterized protein HKW66_Vig0208000 [Vigna angularis]|uniref:Myb-like domain-containing protein n=1 Tax=Phaseolus angularis TaxID=3914 RepID=A0A8T0JJA3_PHAAN|nr:uncharacterized protein HKW66_Vig0208000 [Vigna angularis]